MSGGEIFRNLGRGSLYLRLLQTELLPQPNQQGIVPILYIRAKSTKYPYTTNKNFLNELGRRENKNKGTSN